MDWGTIIFFKLSAVAFLVFLNGFFVAAEFALVKVRDTQLEPLVNKGHKRAKIARLILNNLDAALSATQLGITLASLGLGRLGEPVIAEILNPMLTWMNIESDQLKHSISFGIGFSIISFLHIVVGELAAKSLAIQKPLATSIWVAQPLHWFYKASYPAIWVLNHAAGWLLRRFGVEPVSEGEMAHSEEELRLLFSSNQKHTGGTHFGRDLVLNAMDLRHRTVRAVMRPRKEITALDTEASISECLDIAEKTSYSRFPLVKDDNLDKTLGVIHIKDLYAMRLHSKRGGDLLRVARKLIYVPETANLERVLQLFQERKLHLAIVVDEFGGTVGMVTLENVLEELVGQIQDEFDQEKPLLVQKNETTWELAGNLPLHELTDLTGVEVSDEGVSTVSGWITQELGGFPKRGDTTYLGEYELRVEDMDGPRVALLKLVKHMPPPEEEA
ncbi:MAG: HlyC/CorC family transporter [Verrucomicrobia bacterium]|nr:HlyC/CorC family transporter [Verrucomicrobiota bacterium]